MVFLKVELDDERIMKIELGRCGNLDHVRAHAAEWLNEWYPTCCLDITDSIVTPVPNAPLARLARELKDL